MSTRLGRRRVVLSVLAAVGVAGVLVACTFTQSLDYLTKGDGLAAEAGDETAMVGDTSTSDAGDGSAPVIPLAMSLTKPDLLQQDTTSLYWVGGGNNVYAMPKTGGTPKLLGTAPNSVWLSVDADPQGSVFVATGSNVQRFAKDGSGGGFAFQPEAGAPSVYVVGADPTSLFVLQVDESGAVPDAVLRMQRNGTNPEVLSGATVPDSMTVGTKSVFWFDSSATPEMAYAFPKTAAATTAPMSFRFGADDVAPTYPQDAVTDDAALYWTDDTAGVLSLQLTANAPVIPLYVATDTDMFGPLAVDGTNVYVIQVQTRGILRVPKTGKAPALIAKGLTSPSSIAVDANNVYVTLTGTGAAGGSIVRIPK